MRHGNEADSGRPFYDRLGPRPFLDPPVTLSSIQPDPTLAPYVHSFIYHADYCPIEPKERVIPDGSPYLIFALDGFPRRVFDNETLEPRLKLSGAWLSGVQRDFLTIEALADSRMAVIRFSPGGARTVLQETMESSIGRILPLEALESIGVHKLLARMVEADGPEECWTLVRDWIKSRVDEGPRISAVIQEAVGAIESDPTFTHHGLPDLVAASGYSQKQFIHLFKREIGLTPKAYQRIMRFHEILPLVVEEREISWAEVSQQCGYYDQSHFIREFRTFCGYNPAEYLRGGGGRTNFLPLAER